MLMKGEDIPEGATFSGNPAREVVVPAARRPAPPLEIAGGPRHRSYEAAAGTPTCRRTTEPTGGKRGGAAHRQRK